MTVLEWKSPSPGLPLGPEDLHVWRAALDQPEAVRQRLYEYLAADEQARANRFYFQRDRRRFIVGRAVLRTILGAYMQSAPGELVFEAGPLGKPFLAGSPLHFNASHSNELALVAVTRGQDVGIDVEYAYRPLDDADQLVERNFSSAERLAYSAIPPAERQAAFFRCWTRKEAFIKAIGEGLSHPLDRFDVAFAPGQPAAILSIDGEPEAAQQWTLTSLELDGGYTCAVALLGRAWRLAGWLWDSRLL